ncbi:AMP-binding protein [Bosea sp. 685]|uniref:AMP-binding protein n=1 Tax=Bosea sp. 685 TaxID=3080057 RepID=UPI0028937E7C|nr:AMP-binding protein [Bosea sp. 685]WNJ88810.1 AMP-binding protein [Bosea sp. 685]
MVSLREAESSFNYERAAAEVLGGRLDSMNAAFECCDRHDAHKVALVWESDTGKSEEWTFGKLSQHSQQLANVLKQQGVQPGDCVGGLLPRIPELIVTILATWRVGGIYQPLFTAFGPKAIEHRVTTAKTRVVVTTPADRSKLDGVFEGTVISTDATAPNDIDFWSEIRTASEQFEAVARDGEDPFLMMFTSGTTGLAKPLMVPNKAIIAFAAYLRDAVGLRPEDNFWNMADPGWAYGLYNGIVGPLALGHTTTFFDGRFTVDNFCKLIERRRISNLIGAPTAYRMIMAEGPAAAASIKGMLRVVSSAGEPLNPEVARWFKDELGAPIYDHFGQTEVGMVLCNHHHLEHPVVLGAAGRASPGYHLVVLGEDHQERPAGEPGVLAIDRVKSPLMWFKGYHGVETKAFVGDYYLTGDTVVLNADGNITFVGREDDIITSAGYRIGPFDVESALMEHPAIAETAVIGKPDPERTEVVKAFIVLKAGENASDALISELQQHVRKRLSAHAYPREIVFVQSLPKTPSGKVQRGVLRQREVAAANLGTAA